MNENEQRDELARDIFIADNSEFPETQMLAKWESHSADHLRPIARIVANGLFTKGYRKPRTITTVEELDALANGTTLNVMAGQPFPVYRWDDCWNFPVGYGSWCDSKKLFVAWGGKGFTVLHEVGA